MQNLVSVTMDDMQNIKRLLDKFNPISYNLTISLNRLNRTFEGYVEIVGFLNIDSDTISLHSKDLNIISAKVDGKNIDYIKKDNDELVLLVERISKGQHEIQITYIGKITDAMHGIYPCYYEYNGVKKELLATQFESHHAREAFPCIDEPSAKAIYDLKLYTELDVTVIGNMPIRDQSTEDDKLVTVFETTPMMSSYLLAWVVGELHKKTAYTKSGVEVNVWATIAQDKNYLDFALDIATRAIDFFDDYFSTPYPLPKCDHVALPDFSSGAMENWGLITYREITLLVDSEKTSIAIKQHVSKVITHELSHQWFGNLVTMKWWNDLWLNESFASLVEYTAVDALEPNWNIWYDFASFESICALRRDSLSGVQPVKVEVNHPDEIMSLFDGAIVYAKGARLLKMLVRYIGEDDFRAGLKNYFETYAYKNTESIDLWNCLSHTSGRDLIKFMDSWLKQSGFPIVHLSLNDNELTLTQEKISNNIDNKSDNLWPIPLNSNYTNLPEVFDKRTYKLNDFILSEPIRLNTSNDAHYITHYDKELLMKLVEQIKNNQLPIIDRMQLLNEQVILANVGIISYADLIPLLSAYNNECTEVVWGIISMTIGELKKFVESDEEAEKKLRALAGNLARNQFEKLGWFKKINEDGADSKLRSIIIGLMAYSEDKTVLSTAINFYETTNIKKLDPELRSHILTVAVRHGNEDEAIISDLLNLYKSSDSPELKQDICIALSSTKKIEMIHKLLNTVTDRSVIRAQDMSHWIVNLLRNKYSRDITWHWIIDNWEIIKQEFSGDKSYDEYPKYSASFLITKKQLDEYINFFSPKKEEPALTRIIDVGINEIKNRVKIIEDNESSVKIALGNL